jgi:hypothetical protein
MQSKISKFAGIDADKLIAEEIIHTIENINA